MSIREKIEKKNLPHGIHIMEPDNPSGSEASEALEPTSSEPGKARLELSLPPTHGSQEFPEVVKAI